MKHYIIEILITTALVLIWEYISRRFLSKTHEIFKAKCLDGYCDAFRYDFCHDGRCKWHCGVYCKCIPIPTGKFKPTVIKGGK